jgi:hypothetical protein
MNSLYHKIAITSVCTALSFTLGTNQEAKAVTFTLTAPRFVVRGNSEFGGVWVSNGDSSGISITDSPYAYDYDNFVTRAFYEFNLGNLSLAPDSVISRAFFNVKVKDILNDYKYFFIDILGYVGNGIPELSDFEIGERLALIDLEPITNYPIPEYPISIDVTQLINQRVSNGDAFAGFGLRGSTAGPSYGSASLSNSAELTIETEPVPEPTTMFGSALALGVGGWLKRKKLSQHSKTTSKH